MSVEEEKAAPQEPSFFRQREEERLQPAPGLAPGKVVGEFRLVAMIGQGGMGQVWEAEQLSLGKRRVAVKFVRPERVTEKQLELFAREARAGGRLSHPGIVGVHEYGHSDGLAWIAMEFIGGAWTLKDFLDDVARAPETPRGYDRHVARFVAEVAEAMQAAHEASVIHRDLKPQNILITADDHPKVTDFGLARITDETALSQTGDFAGTYFYMSPEQVTAKRIGIDQRSDVFSLGVVLYELLALRRPFLGDTTHQVAEQIVMEDPPDPRTIRSKVPRDLAVIAGRALEKSRDKRFQTMQEFAADLRRYLADEPIHARPPSALERGLKWMRRNPAKSSVASVVLVALVVISVLLGKNVRANRELAAKTQESERRRVEAERSAAAERQRASEVLRLSDLQDLEDLVHAADELWPARPENVPRFQDWIQRAQRLVAKLPAHRDTLAQLRSHALPRTEEERLAERESHPEWAHLQALEGELSLQRRAEAQLAELEASRTVLDARVDQRRDLRFPEEHERWWNNQLAKLIAELEALQAGLLASDAVTPEHGWSIPKRLALAERLRDGLVPGGEFERAWNRALPDIRAAYPELDLAPQIGLVPLGTDPFTSLWEFADIASGEMPRRGSDGSLLMNKETGLVFVLLPGGTYSMGAQKTDPAAPNYDPDQAPDETPVRTIELAPFFLSKYETTQAQWLRITGEQPSFLGPHHWAAPWNRDEAKPLLTHPVEKVSWNECARLCQRFSFALPTEAQWEYAVRGGTQEPWWFGTDAAALATAGNVADRQAAKFAQAGLQYATWDDGAAVHLPVDGQDPNPFGFHGMLGNVWEWCLDGHYNDAYRIAAGPDPVAPPNEAGARVRRGGAYSSPFTDTRSANRGSDNQDTAVAECGLRPARAIERR